MLNLELTDDFKFIVEEFGEPETLRSLEDSEIEKFRGRIPNALLAFWQKYGLCQFWGGLLRFGHPDEMRSILSLASGNDAQFDPARCHIVAQSAFGELFIWSEQFQRIFLDLTDLTMRSRVMEDEALRIDDEDRAVAFLFGGAKRDFDMVDGNGKLLYSRCRSKLGALEADECYGFHPALMLGGEADIRFVRRVKALEHFAILAQLDRPTLVHILDNGQLEAIRQIG